VNVAKTYLVYWCECC